MPIETLMVTTDFSQAAESAIDWAADLAQAHRARLVLVHALPPELSTAVVPELVPVPGDFYRKNRELAAKQLDERAAELTQRGCPSASLLVTGHTGPVIVEAVEKESPDLLVAGTRGQTHLTRALLGSVSARLVRDARCPVLSVGPGLAGRQRPIRCILAATDFSDDSIAALEAGLALVVGALADIKVTLLHVSQLPGDGLLSLPPRPEPRVYTEIAESIRERLRELVPRLGGADVEIAARLGAPAAVIDAEARRIEADLITMGAFGRSGLKRLFLGTTAERVLADAPCPVLTVSTADR